MTNSRITAAQNQEIEDARSMTSVTRRTTVPAMEDLMYTMIPVLDHGYLRVIDYMGDDSAVIQAARTSYGRGTKHKQNDEGLIRYLLRHWHTTPFEMLEIKIAVKMPIITARQWIRHRHASVNELSARYSILDREFYVPDAKDLAAQSQTNKQGRGDLLTGEEATRVLDLLRDDANRNYDHYAWMLNEDQQGKIIDPNRKGLSRELARMNLTLATYTTWYWKVNVHGLMNFLRLRADHHAQYEIRVYAEVLLDIMRQWLPMTHNAFMDYRVNAISLSAQQIEAINMRLAGRDITPQNTSLTKREFDEMVASMPGLIKQA
jgi:thymidylate synthase (FAD)